MTGPLQDSIQGIEPTSRSRAGWFFLLILLFVIGGFYFTVDKNNVFTDHTPSEDLDNLLSGFESLMFGDVSGFLEGIFGGITIVALFMIMFALMHFLFSTALKPLFPKKKYATVLALVLSVYAFVNPTIYNYLLNLNAFAVGFMVFVLLVVMLWSFVGKSGADVKGSFEEIANLRKNPELINDKEYVRKLKAALAEERRARR